MFEPRNAFVLPQAATSDRFVATWARSDFRRWMSDTQASDDAADREPATIIDATDQLRADAFAQGLIEGEAMAREAAAGAVMDAAARIAAAADRFDPVCDTMMAALLAETVTKLVKEMFDTDVAAPEHLARRATQLARMIRDEVDPVCVRLHPDDAMTLADAALPWPVVADSTVERGEIRLETSEGGITDNPAERIERLRCRIAGEVSQ